MRVDPETGLVTTAPVETPRAMHETRAVATAPPDDELTFGDAGIDRAFTKYMTDVLVDISDTFDRERDKGHEECTQLEKQINAMRTEFAELRGEARVEIAAKVNRQTQDFAQQIDALKTRMETNHQLHAGKIADLQSQIAELRGRVDQIGTREKGEKGERGERGPRGATGQEGARGEPGMSPRAVTVKRWQIDKRRYLAIPIMSDNSVGPSIELRGLFEQFNEETAPYGHRPE
jgi:hypothetical protein